MATPIPDDAIVQVNRYIWKGCIGVVQHTDKQKFGTVPNYFVDLTRYGVLCFKHEELIVLTDEQLETGELPLEIVDPHMALFQFELRMKQQWKRLIDEDIEFLHKRIKECEEGGTFTHADRDRLRATASRYDLGLG